MSVFKSIRAAGMRPPIHREFHSHSFVSLPSPPPTSATFTCLDAHAFQPFSSHLSSFSSSFISPPFPLPSSSNFCHLHLPRCPRLSTITSPSFPHLSSFPILAAFLIFLFLHFLHFSQFTLFSCFHPFLYSSIFSLGFLSMMMMVVVVIVYGYGDHRVRCDAVYQYSRPSLTITMVIITMVMVMGIFKITMIMTMMVMMIGGDHIVPCDAFHRHSWASLTDGRPNTSHSHRAGIPKGEKECVTRAPLIFSSTLLFISQSPRSIICVSHILGL